jgi:hypothetical protein
VTGHLLRLAPANQAGRLCVLGAGNCNDLDLAALSASYREVHLVDLDQEALAQAVAHQRPADAGRLYLHGGIDLTGILDQLAAPCSASASDDDQFEKALRGAAGSSVDLPGPFEVVASVCVLTQLIEAVLLSSFRSHPRLFDLALAVRTRHLQQLVDLIAPGGSGLLVTDVVSSESYPPLAHTPEVELPRTLQRLIAERNFFHGVNPIVLATLLRTEGALAAQVAECELLPPWLWDFGPRTYAVCALRLRRL